LSGMPTYGYRCPKGHDFEGIHAMGRSASDRLRGLRCSTGEQSLLPDLHVLHRNRLLFDGLRPARAEVRIGISSGRQDIRQPRKEDRREDHEEARTRVDATAPTTTLPPHVPSVPFPTRPAPETGSQSGSARLRARPRDPGYALCVKRLRAFLERLPGGHRPPTGPMTTEEAADAEKVRQETPAKDDRETVNEQGEASNPPGPEVPLR
jgi:hypothetical protein